MMDNIPGTEHQIRCVSNFKELVSTPFHGAMNAICWSRTLTGDFEEIVNRVDLNENIRVLDEEDLLALGLSDEGKLAREILLDDLKLLKDYGASPMLNVIRCYDRDDACPFFPTDVYSFHVDRSPVATDTFYALIMASQVKYCLMRMPRKKCLFLKYAMNLKNCTAEQQPVLKNF